MAAGMPSRQEVMESCTIDHTDHLSSEEVQRASNNDSLALRKSMFGLLNRHWKLGDSSSPARDGDESTARSTPLSSLINFTDESTVSHQSKLEISDEHENSSEARKTAFPLKECKLWQTGGNGKDVVKSTLTECQSIESSYTSLGDDAWNWVSSSHHLGVGSPKDATSMSNNFACNRTSNSSNLETSCSLQFRQPESRYATLSSRWREIQGATNWEGLLDPLDLDLRREILRYGDFAQTTYDNVECEARSKYAGSARYPKQGMFDKLHKQKLGSYQVTRYLYATCENPLPSALLSCLFSERWDVESNWMGYVAVATDPQEIERLGRRDIVVAWRGTVRTIEWLLDAQIQMASISIETENPMNACPKVEKGFWSLYTCKRSSSQFNRNSASEQVIAEITRLLKLYEGETLSITLTGHSLGGALAILTAYEIAALGLNKSLEGELIPVTVFTFGSPQVGDSVFRAAFEAKQLKALRVVEVHDLVPKTIPRVCFPWMMETTYEHVGDALHIDHSLSPYLKRSHDPLDWHTLECYLHLVDGHHQGRHRFELVTGRDYALVNKYADILDARYRIPTNWWQAENKGLVLSLEGRWVEPDRSVEDTPSLDNHESFI